MVRNQEIGPADQVWREANEDGGEAGLGSPLPSRDPDGGRQKQVVDKHGQVGPAKKPASSALSQVPAAADGGRFGFQQQRLMPEIFLQSAAEG